jgi:hypothetical protein
MADSWREFLGAWEGFRIETEEVRELDDGRVLTLSHRSGRGKTSGIELAAVKRRSLNIFDVHDGKVTRLEHYWDGDAALADLGLVSEGDTRPARDREPT